MLIQRPQKHIQMIHGELLLQGIADPLPCRCKAGPKKVEEEDSLGLRQAEKRLQKLDGSGVSPVQVFHDDHEGRPLRTLDEEVSEALEDQSLQGLALKSLDSFCVLAPERYPHEGRHKGN